MFRYVKSDDFSSLKDLQQHAKNSLALNSKPRKELTIKTSRPFLELWDSVLLNFNDFKFDGRYVCYAFNAILSSLISNSDITYRLRSGLNTDTLINFYDSQDYKQKPVIKDKKDIVYRYIDKTLGVGNIQYLTENPPRIRSNFSHSAHAEYRPNINIDT